MKKLLALVLALVMTLGLATVSTNAKLSDFPDAKSINFDEAAAVMNAVGVFMGDQNGEFRPTAQLTRAEAAKIIAYMMLGNKAAESVVPSGAKFKDVAANAWYAKYIEYLASVSIMQGDEKGNANPDGALTAIDFAKMLLVSLGYDPKVEGLVGVDYRINTSKLANLVGLFDGNEDNVVATNPVTREEAALYTFNAVKTPLVEYSSKGSTLTVNGAELNFGASNYTYVVSTLAKEQRISNQKLTNTGTTSDGGYTVEFGERYYPKLQLIATDDDFGRPANKWVYDNKDVGTYVQKDKLLASYTAKVNGKTLWELLGTERVWAGKLTYKVDGVVVAGDITQANIAKTNTINYANPGKGVLTEVYSVGDDLVIVSINSYMAKATTDYNSTKNDISIKIFNTGTGLANSAGTNQDSIVVTVSGEDIPEISNYKKDTPLRLTVAWKNNARTLGNEIVETAVVPEFTTANTVTKFSTGDKYLVTGGEQKDYAAKVFLAPDEKSGTDSPLSLYAENNALTDYTYNISYDAYGYVLGVEIYEGESKHVFLTGFDYSGSNLASGEATGYLIFSDGTTKTAKIDTEATNKLLSKAGKGAAGDEKDATNYPYLSKATEGLAKGAQYNMWFTYTEKGGVYTLKPVQYWIARANTATVTDAQKINPTTAKVSGSVGATKSGQLIGYGNDNSTYITAEAGEITNTTLVAPNNLGIKKVTGIYTGIQKVDLKPFAQGNTKEADLGAGTIPGLVTPGDFFAVLNADNYIVNAVVVGEDVGTTANYAYIVKLAQNEYVKDGNYYWEFQAIHEGELKTMTVKEKYDQAISTKIKTAFGPGYQNGGGYATNTYSRPVVMTLKLDKDGFVVDADLVDNDTGLAGTGAGKLYGNTSDAATLQISSNIKVWETYTNGATVTLGSIGRTLYTINGAVYNIGLTVAPSAPIYVIQRLNYADGRSSKNPSVEQYSDLATAVASLAGNGATFNGVISAALNDNGTAKWIVIKSATPVSVGSTSTNPYTSGAAIEVTSSSGSAGMPKAGDTLQIVVNNAATTSVTVRVIVNGIVTNTYSPISVVQGVNTTTINVGKGSSYVVDSNQVAGITGSGTGQ